MHSNNAWNGAPGHWPHPYLPPMLLTFVLSAEHAWNHPSDVCAKQINKKINGPFPPYFSFIIGFCYNRSVCFLPFKHGVGRGGDPWHSSLSTSKIFHTASHTSPHSTQPYSEYWLFPGRLKKREFIWHAGMRAHFWASVIKRPANEFPSLNHSYRRADYETWLRNVGVNTCYKTSPFIS